MSGVTNILLCLGRDDARKAEGKIADVNRFFDCAWAYGGKGFVCLDDPALPKGWYGGSKYLEASVYAGAFNQLPLDSLIEHLRSIEWEEPQCVQLLVQEQDDERFRLINVMDDVT